MASSSNSSNNDDDSNNNKLDLDHRCEPLKTALVTGSSSGIGEAIVKQLAKLNFKLVVTGRNESDISRVAEECRRLSPSGLKVSCPAECLSNLVP